MKRTACAGRGGRCPHAAVDRGLCAICVQARLPKNVAYGRPHARLRIEAFIRDHFTCAQCLWRPNWAERVEAVSAIGAQLDESEIQALCAADYRARRRHLQGDHIKPVEQAPELAHVLSNYQTLCSVCNVKGRS